MTRRIAWAVAVLALVAPGARLFAHPTANTEIILALSDRPQFEVTILTDLDPLVLKLEALAGLRPSDNLSIDAREGRIVSLRRTLVEHLDLRFDDRPAALDLVAIERPRDRQGKVVVRLSGRVPATPSHATWRTDLVFGSYPFVVRTSPDREVFEWLNGTERSQRYQLDAGAGPIQSSQIGRSIALGFTHILPNGLDHILFVLGLFLLARRTRDVLLQVSAFTVAHSVTLGLALSASCPRRRAGRAAHRAVDRVCRRSKTSLPHAARPGVSRSCSRSACCTASDLPRRCAMLERAASAALARHARRIQRRRRSRSTGGDPARGRARSSARCAIPRRDYRRLVVRPARS